MRGLLLRLGCIFQAKSRQFVTADIYRPNLLVSDSPSVTSLPVTGFIYSSSEVMSTVQSVLSAGRNELAVLVVEMINGT